MELAIKTLNPKLPGGGMSIFKQHKVDRRTASVVDLIKRTCATPGRGRGWLAILCGLGSRV